MVGWRIRADMAEIDVGRVYSGNPSIFSIKLFYNGVFTKFPGRRYIKGKVKYVDLVDIDEFSIHDIDEMMDILSCVEEGKLLYYHFKRPLSDLDTGLFALACDSDINHLRTYVEKHKLIEVYIEHEDFDQDFTSFVQDEVNQSEDIGVHGDDLTDSEDSDFLLDEDNMIEEPDIVMKEFFSNIDQNAEWMGDNGGSSMNVEDGKEDEQIEQHAVETRREIVIIKNDKNRVRAVCKGSIPDLIEVGVGGPVEERKCLWVLYASKWSNNADWEVESNPTIPTRALQEQLQRQYQCDISKMKVFREKTEANIHVRDTTVKIKVETEPNPHCESRIFKRIYICLGSLKNGFAAGKRDYLGLDGSFMKGPYPGIVLTVVGLDGPWMDQCVVDMVQHTCSCRKRELTGIPCKHAIVAIWDMRKNNKDVGLPESWVHPTYWLKTWKEIPKKKRKKSDVEDLVKGNSASRKNKFVTCSKCKNNGHNARSYKGQKENGVGKEDGVGKKADGDGKKTNGDGKKKAVGAGKKPNGAGKKGKNGAGKKKVVGVGKKPNSAGKKGKNVV
ncbi:unnamed protein product [Lactuca saligna]|uniref:SWIM-type domain-containing protein n=1 Tax=Lactuca saligna TaxID=75948 RepID=A0AA35VSY6_LACSI|nr:unnamed protein product [Lactuca saligna]